MGRPKSGVLQRLIKWAVLNSSLLLTVTVVLIALASAGLIGYRILPQAVRPTAVVTITLGGVVAVVTLAAKIIDSTCGAHSLNTAEDILLSEGAKPLHELQQRLFQEHYLCGDLILTDVWMVAKLATRQRIGRRKTDNGFEYYVK